MPRVRLVMRCGCMQPAPPPACPAVFEETSELSASSYFGEIIASVSDIQFTRDGRYIISRDYMTIKVCLVAGCAVVLFRLAGQSPHPQVWDIAMEARPVRTIPVHEYLRGRLVDLYESDCIFDKFQVACSGDARSLMTGSYNNCFKLYDMADNTEVTIELSKARPKPPVVRGIEGTDAAATNAANGGPPFAPAVNSAEIDFAKKVLHYSWHATEDIVAIAGLNNLYIYHA